MERIASFRELNLSKAVQGVCFGVSTFMTFLLFGMRHSKKWAEDGGWKEEHVWLDRFMIGEK